MVGITEQENRNSLSIVSLAVLLAIIPAMAVFSRHVSYAAPAPPPKTTSRYMMTVDPNILYNEGCIQGKAKENGIVVLDFGQPSYQGSTYGTILFSNRFASLDQITFASEGFLRGFWDCSANNGPFITLALGTSNYHGDTTFDHGRAWALAVNQVGAWVVANNLGSQEMVAGASDMEVGWNSTSATRAWADGYTSVHQYFYYNYGDAAGCSQVATTGNGSCNNGWKQSDIVYLSWDEEAALPLPEIHTTSGSQARQWYSLTLYSYLHPGQFGRMFSVGSFTQFAACQNSDCTGTDNTPTQGWIQLWTALNADPRTAQGLLYSADITKAN
jgi:hypothetical protein